MRELSDPVTRVLDGLTIPPEREMPRAAVTARKQALLAAIVAEASREPASLAERIQLRLRTIFGLFVMLVVALALVVACTVMSASGGSSKRVAELTVATSAVTAVALSASSAVRLGGDANPLLLVGAQVRVFASG